MLSKQYNMKHQKNILGILSSFILLPGVYAQSDYRKPNIIFILADDLGWADLPMYGNNFNESPNLTELAQSGIQFYNAYAAAPVSSPTRASIQTGKYPTHVGLFEFIPGHFRPYEEVITPVNKTQYLPQQMVTIAEVLKSAGYKTGYFGKWHLGDDIQHHPLNQGYDIANIGQGFYNVNFSPPRDDSKEKIISERLTDFAIEFIETNKKDPFFLFISHWDVHCPYDAEDKIIEKYLNKEKVPNYTCNALYAAMIEQMDQSIGRLLNKLKKESLLNNSIIIFTSDNGGCTSENKYPGIKEEKYPMIVATKKDKYSLDNPLQYIGTVNTPLRNEKGSLYEGGIRVPLIFYWPNKIPRGGCNYEITSSVDFFSTFIDVAGARNPQNQVNDGKSLIPILLYNYKYEREIYWHYPVYHHDFPSAAIRKGDWKLMKNLVNGKTKLYNLNIDISETTDLSSLYPDITDELHASLEKWQKDTDALFPIKNPNFNEKNRYLWGTRN